LRPNKYNVIRGKDMGYRITNDYRWYLVPNEPPQIAKVYYIEGIPFDIDYPNKIQKDNPEIASEADRNRGIHAEELFRKSDYLIAEMLHPLLFELELENPEELPTDDAF
jgi:hypothetical protein